MPATSLTQSEFEQRFGTDTIRRFFDDRGNGKADPALVMACLSTADNLARSILAKGWSQENAIRVLQDDASARDAAYEIAAGIMGRRRPEFFQNGMGPYDATRKNGEGALEKIGDARRKSVSTTAGTNAHVAAGMTRKPSPERTFLTGRRYGNRERSGY